ncbi:early nodulin-like protein 18 [Phragmites australis]|uniref:early nodulin-like protein 18 n=1 Tax=Phragmites australis TaxID=29695 RepID=UPI002D787888|nr:early nodulin-like protein 18 [Phragmites australis]
MARPYRLGLVCFSLLVAAASATQFRVGGQKGWSVPDSGFEPYNTWAGRLRFQIGDQLLFVYPKETDSVLLVEPAAYNACNTSSYVRKFDDGATVFTFNRSGPFFFISGSEANCRANEKLIVVVLADRSGTRTPRAPSTTPPPSSAASPSSPPSAAPMPSPSSPPPAALLPAPAATPSLAPSPASSAPAATPSLAPSPASSAPAAAPTTTPSSPPSPAALAPSPSTSPATPGGVPQPPSASANAPSAEGGSTSTPTPPAAKGQSGAATVVAGFVGSLGAYIGYAMLAM